MYSVKIGAWKSIKNTLIVLLPSLTAAWAAFQTNLPAEYQGMAMAVGGFIGYFVKNWLQQK